MISSSDYLDTLILSWLFFEINHLDAVILFFIKYHQPSTDLVTCSWMQTVSINIIMPVCACLYGLVEQHAQVKKLSIRFVIIKTPHPKKDEFNKLSQHKGARH